MSIKENGISGVRSIRDSTAPGPEAQVSINAQSAAEQNWMIQIWSSASVPNVTGIMNTARTICLHISI